MKQAIALGVDGIITNHPDRLIHLLKEKNFCTGSGENDISILIRSEKSWYLRLLADIHTR